MEGIGSAADPPPPPPTRSASSLLVCAGGTKFVAVVEVNVCSQIVLEISVPVPHGLVTANAGAAPIKRPEIPAVANTAIAVDVRRTTSFTSSSTPGGRGSL